MCTVQVFHMCTVSDNTEKYKHLKNKYRKIINVNVLL